MEKVNLININTCADVRDKYNNSLRWRCFSKRICKNSFVLNYLLVREKHICPWCNKSLNNRHILIHHIDYDNECYKEDCIEIPRPTEKKPNRMVRVPDCEKCFYENKAKFETCMNKITVVHSVCNMIIHKVKKKNG